VLFRSVELPDLSLCGPDINIKGPKIEKPDLKINVPKVDADLKIKGPKIEKPDLDINVPKLDADIKIKGPKVPKPDFNFKAPKIEFPDFNFKKPKIDKPDFNIDLNLPKVDLDINAPKVDLDINAPKVDLDINAPKLDLDFSTPKIDLDINTPNVETDFDCNICLKKEAQIDISSPELKGGIKGFFKGIGGKIKAPEVELPDLNICTPDVEVNLPKVDTHIKSKTLTLEKPTKVPKIDVNIKEPKVTLPEQDAISADLKCGFKGFFKGIGGKIKSPEVEIPDVDLKTPKIKKSEIVIDTPKIDTDIKMKVPKVDYDLTIKTPQLDIHEASLKTSSIHLPEFNVKTPQIETFIDTSGSLTEHTYSTSKADSNKTDIFIRGLDLHEHKQFVYGLDLPMTIVNNDWHWSPESVHDGVKDRKIFFRQYTDSSTASSNYINSGSFVMGNLNLITKAENSSMVSKTVEIDHTIIQAPSRPVVDFELKKATIRKDPLLSANLSTSIHNTSGESVSAALNNELSEQSERFPKSKSSTGSFFRRKLSSASSISNLDSKTPSKLKSSFITRSESADPTARVKTDYSIPRKCYIFTKPDFNGLGIHIACDKKTRRFPYIYEIEPNSPGMKSGLRKNDFILEINEEDAVDMEFKELIGKIQEFIKENNLCLTVGNEKAHKKWIKTRSVSLNRNKSKV